MPATGSSSREVLVPEELFDGAPEEWLRINGMALGVGESAVVSGPVDGIMAVSVGGESALLPLVSRVKSRWKKGRGVWLDRCGEGVSIVVWDDGLRLAHVLPDGSADSVLYYLQVLGRTYALRRFEIVASAYYLPVLRPYYKKVRAAD